MYQAPRHTGRRMDGRTHPDTVHRHANRPAQRSCLEQMPKLPDVHDPQLSAMELVMQILRVKGMTDFGPASVRRCISRIWTQTREGPRDGAPSQRTRRQWDMA